MIIKNAYANLCKQASLKNYTNLCKIKFSQNYLLNNLVFCFELSIIIPDHGTGGVIFDQMHILEQE